MTSTAVQKSRYALASVCVVTAMLLGFVIGAVPALAQGEEADRSVVSIHVIKDGLIRGVRLHGRHLGLSTDGFLGTECQR